VSQARYGLPHRVVAAVDPFEPGTQISGLNDTIIQCAYSMALQCDAPLHLLYAYDLSPGIQRRCADGHGRLERGLRRRAAPVVAPGIRHLGRPLWRTAGKTALCHGPASAGDSGVCRAIPRPTWWSWGLLTGSGSTRLIGSNTERALYSVPGSILAIRQPGNDVKG
jgi:universal stress protein E